MMIPAISPSYHKSFVSRVANASTIQKTPAKTRSHHKRPISSTPDLSFYAYQASCGWLRLVIAHFPLDSVYGR